MVVGVGLRWVDGVRLVLIGDGECLGTDIGGAAIGTSLGWGFGAKGVRFGEAEG